LLIMDMKQIFQEKYQCFFLIKKANRDFTRSVSLLQWFVFKTSILSSISIL
jgi:hypothetical protein